MIIEVNLTEEIINESLPLYYRYMPFQQKWLPFLLPAFFAAIIVVLQLRQSYANENEAVNPIYVSVIIILVGLRTAWNIYKRNRAGKMVLKQLGKDANYRVEVNDKELLFTLASKIGSKQWSDYFKAVISTDIVILYQSTDSYLTFHHTFFTNDDFSRFKQLVRNRVHEVKED